MITAPFTPGTAYTDTLTNATNPAIVNGTPVTIYLAECDNAGQCSAWAGPSNQVTPYGPAAKPAVTATANGTSVSYTWSVAGNGQAGVLQVSYSEPGGTVSNNNDDYGAAGLNGAITVAGFGNDVTVTITATGPGGTATATATTAAAVPPDAPTDVTATATGANNTIKFGFTAGAGNGAPIASIEYGINAATETGTIAGPFTAGTAYTETVTNAAIVNGAATTVYVAECNNAGLCSAWAGPSNQVTPGPQATGTLAVSDGGGGSGSGGNWIRITVSNFPANSLVQYTCTGAGFYTGTSGKIYDTDYSGTTMQTDATGSVAFDSAYFLYDGGGQGPFSVTCTSGGVQGTGSISAAGTPSQGAVNVTEGAAFQGPSGTPYGNACPVVACNFASITITGFPGYSVVWYECTDDGGAHYYGGGGQLMTDASGYATIPNAIPFPSTDFSPTSGIQVSCQSDNVTGTYGG